MSRDAELNAKLQDTSDKWAGETFVRMVQTVKKAGGEQADVVTFMARLLFELGMYIEPRGNRDLVIDAIAAIAKQQLDENDPMNAEPAGHG